MITSSALAKSTCEVGLSTRTDGRTDGQTKTSKTHLEIPSSETCVRVQEFDVDEVER